MARNAEAFIVHLGEGPTADAISIVGKRGAGMAALPRHHVFPKEMRGLFEKLGFTGAKDIDNFTVALEEAHHQAIHGGGNWKLGRDWAGEWNNQVRIRLDDLIEEHGGEVSEEAVLDMIIKMMKEYDIPLDFLHYGAPR